MSANDDFDDTLTYIYCFLHEKKIGQKFPKMNTVCVRNNAVIHSAYGQSQPEYKYKLQNRGVRGAPDLADQLPLSQPEVANYAHQIILAPPDFQTFLRPCYV